MAVRVCPLCEARIESYPGVTLKRRAVEHYFITHKSIGMSPEESHIFTLFYNTIQQPVGRK